MNKINVKMKWIDAEEALARLGTKRQTLYANVSRGRIRARPDPSDTRKSQYADADVERLAARRRGRPAVRSVAADTIRWGEPVLNSSISTIADGRLVYRGHDVAELAATAELEDVCALLWQTDRPVFDGTGADEPGMPVALLMLARRALADPPTLGRSMPTLRRAVERVYADFAGHLTGPGEGALAARLATRWRRPQAEPVLRAALVLLADHELNASTFAARVTASTGAPLSACLLSGVCTLSGPLHGGVATAIATLADSAAERGAEAAVRQWLAQGQALPAFGHTLYPNGDIRAEVLLSLLELPPYLADLKQAAEEMTGERANVDFALCALTHRFGLPEEAPLLIFALARSVGWLAHALEQIETGELIRPRARYAGQLPN